MRHVALLRGVNVGGSRLMQRTELEAAFRAAGGENVASYIQSGNVIFESERAEALASVAGASIEQRLGFRPAIILRSADEWRAIVAGNPFVALGAPAEELHVAALAARPTQAAIARLDRESLLPDEFAVSGADVYLHLPNGVARSNLTNARLDKALGTVSTMRNWRTALALLERLC